WGDGSESSGVAPSHSYSAPGVFSLTLTVTDNYGVSSLAATRTVTVSTPAEIAEEEAAARKAEEEAAARKAAEEAAARKAAEEAARARAQAETAARARAEAEAALRRAAEEAAARALSGTGGREVAGFQTGLAAAVPDATLAGVSLQASSTGVIVLRISCPAGETSCVGVVTLRTLGAVLAASGSSAKARPAVLTLATGPFTVAGGRTAALSLHMSARARALLSRSRLLRARATLTAHDLAGATHVAQEIVTLRAPRARRGKG